MSISGAFIRRPIATSLLMIGILLAGLAGYRELPVSARCRRLTIRRLWCRRRCRGPVRNDVIGG